MLVAYILGYALAVSGLGQVDPSGPASPVQQPVQPPTAPAVSMLSIPAGTQVELELVNTLSSTTSHLADRFAIRLAAPISVNGVEVVAAGAVGQGEVIDVGRSGMGGKQGKLIISARYLDLNGQRVRLRGMTLMAAGESQVDLARHVMLVPYAGIAAGFITGSEISIPSGTRARARLADDVALPVGAPAASASN